MKLFKPEIALIMRSDEIIKEFNLKRVSVKTSYGIVNRCYEGYIYDVPVLMIYGRFNGEKVPSGEINFGQTIEVVKNKEINKIIATFVVGGINPDREQGSVYILGNMVGIGNYRANWNKAISFHNAEMLNPFCSELIKKLETAADKMPFKVIKDAIYVSFTGWPRIETSAELDFYNKMGWDIVGQTCDSEATEARLNGICYAGLAVQIDDPKSRQNYVDGLKNKDPKPLYVETIKSCRERTSKIVMQFIKDYKNNKCEICNKMSRKNTDFREFPDYFYE